MCQMEQTLDRVQASISVELSTAVFNIFQQLVEPVERICSLCECPPDSVHLPEESEWTTNLPAGDPAEVGSILACLTKGCEHISSTLAAVCNQLETAKSDAQSQQEVVHDLQTSVQDAHAEVVQQLELQVSIPSAILWSLSLWHVCRHKGQQKRLR